MKARFNRWWVLMWAFNVVTLAALIPVLRPGQWLSAAIVLFFVPEAIGLLRYGDSLPPLTQTIRRYVPRWVVDAAVYATGAYMVVVWWPVPRPGLAVIIAAVVGWMTNHFDVTFDSRGE